MRDLLSYELLAALLVEACAHVAILVGLVRMRARRDAFAALLLPPLAPYYASVHGMRARTWTWLGAFFAYALGTAVASTVR